MLKALFILGCYLYGSLPVTEVLARRKGTDLRQEGTRKAGAGNLWQTAGARYGLIGGIFDVSKGVLPVLLADRLKLGKGVGAAGSIAGLIGQMWPLFKKFDGGRGNATAIGSLLTLSPRAAIMAMVPMFGGGAIWALPIMVRNDLPWKQRLKFPGRNSDVVPLGMLVGWLGIPLLAYTLKEPKPVTRALLAATIAIMARRVTGGLSRDIAEGRDIKEVLRNRALYDRSTR